MIKTKKDIKDISYRIVNYLERKLGWVTDDIPFDPMAESIREGIENILLDEADIQGFDEDEEFEIEEN